MEGVMMKRGNLVIYDLSGKIWYQSGEAEGSVLPHEYPVGIPHMEIPFGTMVTKRLISIDVTKTPHEPIFEDAVIPKTEEQVKIEELENQVLLLSEVLV